MNKLFASSADPNDVSLTVKGFFALIIPLVTILLNHAGHSIDNSQVQGIEDAITNVVVLVSSALSAIMILVGMVRKIYFSLK